MPVDRNLSRCTASAQGPAAIECLSRLRSRTSAGEFGYKIQALASHVLLGLNHRVVAVNPKGHPDLVSEKDGQEFRFEIEAEVIGARRRMLTSPDFAGLISPGIVGYYALAVSFPRPYWVLVPAQNLVCRKGPAGHALLKAPERQGVFFGLDARVPVHDRSLLSGGVGPVVRSARPTSNCWKAFMNGHWPNPRASASSATSQDCSPRPSQHPFQ